MSPGDTALEQALRDLTRAVDQLRADHTDIQVNMARLQERSEEIPKLRDSMNGLRQDLQTLLLQSAGSQAERKGERKTVAVVWAVILGGVGALGGLMAAVRAILGGK